MSRIEKRIAALEGSPGRVAQDRERLVQDVRNGNPEALARAAREYDIDPEDILARIERTIEEAGPPYTREHLLEVLLGPDWEESLS